MPEYVFRLGRRSGWIMKNFKIFKMILAVVMVFGFIGLLSGCDLTSDSSDLTPVANYTETYPAEPLKNITVRGIVESVESRNVYTTFGQTVRRIDVRVGDRVTEGQVLAILDTDNLLPTITQQISNAEAALRATEVNLRQAQKEYNNALRDYTEGNNQQVLSAESFLRNARIELETSERNYENLRFLYNAGAISREELRQSENALINAQNQYNDARTSYENAALFQQRSLEQLRISLESAIVAHQNAQEMLNVTRTVTEQGLRDSTITAPISGTVTAIIAREGAAGMGRMFVIEDTDNLRIITSFREYDISKIATGMEVTITSDATGDAVYTGIISRINPVATADSPVVEFETEVTVTSADANLRIGTNARVNVILE